MDVNPFVGVSWIKACQEFYLFLQNKRVQDRHKDKAVHDGHSGLQRSIPC